ncbi:MAG: DEAD/DEAH box helicase [bacterium]
MPELKVLDDEYFSVRFQFDPQLVNQIRVLSSRRWNPKTKSWEIHIAHLADVMKIFYLHPRDIPPDLLKLYQAQWIKCRLRIKVGHTYTQFSGTKLPIEKMDDVASFFVAGHEYSSKFIDGAWDGRKHLFDRRKLLLPTGLLHRVLPLFKEAGLEYEMQEKAPKSRKSLKLRKPKEDLRPYQKQAVATLIKQKRGVLEMATGAGKTLVAAHVIAELQRPALFFVHTKDLLHQTRNVFHQCFGQEIGQIGDGVVDIHPITVATIQTTIRAFGGRMGDSLDEEENLEESRTDLTASKDKIIEHVRRIPVAFFDECHHVPAETFYAIAMQTHAAEYRFGLSATPYRADRHDLLLEAALGEKIFQANASHLIEQGYLVPADITFVAVPAYHSAERHQNYQDIYAYYIVESDQRNRLIAERAKQLLSKKKSVLILVSQVAHGKCLKELLPKAEFLEGSDSGEKRHNAWRALEAKKIPLVIATTLADEGLDIPSLDALILAGGGRSETKALQRVGRALRPSPGKTKATIIDFFDQAPYLKVHSLRRYEIYKTEKDFRIQTEGVSFDGN